MSKDLMLALGRRHAVVYGDWGTGKTHRLKTMAQIARNGVNDAQGGVIVEPRQVIVFAMDRSWYGLNDANDYSRYGNDVHGHTLQVDDADALADLAMTGDRESQIICLQHRQPEEVSKFLKDYLANVLGREEVNAVFVFDILDEQAGRKRHQDAITAINLKSLVMRGKSMGASVYASATSPTEIPLEIVHQTAVAVFGRMSHDGNLKGLRMIDRRLANKANSPTYGTKYLEDGVQFFLPQDGSDYPVYFAPSSDIDVGDGRNVKPEDPTDREKASIKKLEDARRDREKAKNDAKDKTRAKASSKCKVSLAKGRQTFVRMESSPDLDMQHNGMRYLNTRVAMARILMSVRDTGTITFDHRPKRKDLMAYAASEQVEASAAWIMKRQRSFAGMTSACMAGALHVMFVQDAGERGETFLDALFGHGTADETINRLARNVRGMHSENSPMADRMTAIRTAWAKRSAGWQKKEAVVVSIADHRIGDAKQVLPSCA